MMGQAIWDRVLTDRERLASARSSVCSVGLSTLRRGKSGMAEEKKHGPERPGAVQTQHKSVNILHPRIQPARLSVEQRMDQGIG